MSTFITPFSRFMKGLWYGFKDPEFQGLFYFVIALLIIGTAVYHFVEGWRTLDALYFSVATLTTIGYGDLAPVSDAGKIFTIIYVFVGVGTILGFINLIAHHGGKNDPIHSMLISPSLNEENNADPIPLNKLN